MKEEELVANCVDARAIRDKLLEALGMSQADLATALGINYQRIYDLGSGRTKKFNPGMVRLITKVFPQVNPNFLYTGEGDVLLPSETVTLKQTDFSDIMALNNRLVALMEKLDAKDIDLRNRENNVLAREMALLERERTLNERELSIGKRELSLLTPPVGS